MTLPLNSNRIIGSQRCPRNSMVFWATAMPTVENTKTSAINASTTQQAVVESYQGAMILLKTGF